MTMSIVIVILFLLLVIGVPVAISMAVSGAIGLYLFGGLPILQGILKTAPLSSTSSYEIITVPMFILMAEFVILSGVANSLFRAGEVWVGRVRGGVAAATVMAGAGFAAISGSSTAAAATLASTSIPEMVKQGYEPKLAGGVVAISGTLAMIIPPSIALILYGIIADISISALFIGAIIPSVLICLSIILTIIGLVCVWPESTPKGRSYTIKEKIYSLKDTAPVLVLFLSVIGSIYSGLATPTEASGVGAFIAMLLAIKERALNWKTLVLALRKTAHTTAMILMIILAAHIFGYYFTLERVTNDLIDWVAQLNFPSWAIMGIILIGYLFLGFFMDQIAILILTVPIVLPLVVSLGYDPVWFGVIVVVTAEVGMVTPPLGMNVFVVARYTKMPLSELFYGVMPHIFVHLLVIAILLAFPQIILWLPSTM
ncbi:Neu5Ac permease [Oligella urethralis]|uniref:TRAP transporter large permease n=1 Tax=Oligella urethralis TaxID=90245 RepID=UPI000CFE857D|nr:TRAP transporter large permease subunit [Oligella urethralis]AVL71957.1 TRAP transporter large permease [Oligella urethralis]SUA52127.1 Neu5Ac permease [Oligella urethralis]